MFIYLSLIIFFNTLTFQERFKVLKTDTDRELKIFKGNDGKTLFFEFCNKEQKNKCLLEVLVFDLRGVVSILSKSPNMGTTEIKDNGKIIRTETGFTYLITQEGISSEAIKSEELINAIREIFF
tara:strand:- start:1407 stop:1778 length:372 start_codon:yes stop_codon:yes gene_type:complete